METKFVWYGKENFNLDKVNWDVVPGFDKPRHGLWGSFEQSDDHFTWKDWCEGEEFHLDHFEYKHVFEIVPTAKILTVNPETIVDFLKKYDPDYKVGTDPRSYWFSGEYNFEEIFANYDGMIVDGHKRDYDAIHGPLNTWDCDSIVIWNRDVIVQ